MRWLTALIIILFLVIMLFAAADLPGRGDPEAPANTHVSPFYIENAVEDTETPNVVTAVLADYRGYDTLGETIVIFTAGLACILIMVRRSG